MRDAAEIEQVINAFAHSSNDGLIVTAGGPAARHRDLIVALAARHNLPAVYFERSFVDIGGLVSYGADYLDQFRRTAGYVDRILKGEKPANLPVQAPTKYELVINLRAHGMACARRRIRRSRYKSTARRRSRSAPRARSPTVCAHRLGLAGSWALRSPIRHQVPPSASGAAAPYRTGQASEAPAA